MKRLLVLLGLLLSFSALANVEMAGFSTSAGTEQAAKQKYVDVSKVLDVDQAEIASVPQIPLFASSSTVPVALIRRAVSALAGGELHLRGPPAVVV